MRLEQGREGSPLFIKESTSPRKRPRIKPAGRINYLHRPLVAYDRSIAYQYEHHEELPRLPSNHPQFVEAECHNREGINRVLDVIQEFDSDERDFEIATIRRELLKQQTIQYGTTLTIGIIGDTGAGKSTVINALLGKENMARTVSARISCCTLRHQRGADIGLG